jgi:lipoate-protein ligase A
LIQLEARPGAENMATDQALLESVDATGRPVLRFYAWDEPTVSLGYFQPTTHRNQHVASGSIACVRRSTGGGAIVHHHELTYSLAVPIDAGSAGPRLDLYRQTHRCLIEALIEQGVRASPFRLLDHGETDSQQDPFLCFQRRTGEDLIVSGYKVVGSAQRKSRRSMLQHGSLLLRASRWAPELPGIEDLTSRAISIEALTASFASRLGSLIAVDWRNSQLSKAEQERTMEVIRNRFGNTSWLNRR